MHKTKMVKQKIHTNNKLPLFLKLQSSQNIKPIFGIYSEDGFLFPFGGGWGRI